MRPKWQAKLPILTQRGAGCRPGKRRNENQWHEIRSANCPCVSKRISTHRNVSNDVSRSQPLTDQRRHIHACVSMQRAVCPYHLEVATSYPYACSYNASLNNSWSNSQPILMCAISIPGSLARERKSTQDFRWRVLACKMTEFLAPENRRDLPANPCTRPERELPPCPTRQPLLQKPVPHIRPAQFACDPHSMHCPATGVG